MNGNSLLEYMKDNKIRTEEMEKLNNYFKQINSMSPFPIIDTEVIMNLDNKLKNNKIDYDSEPVICCAHCKELTIKIDEYNNEFCVLCKNSLNETEIHPTIFHWLNKYKNKDIIDE